jgi:hypothetical protein
MSSQRVLARRLKELEAFADSHTIRVADFVTICDYYLSACAKYVQAHGGG